MKPAPIASLTVLSLAAAATAVPPNPPPPQSVGPDVVVSAIGSAGGSSPYGDASGGGPSTQKDGTVGSISAWSIGTTSCNIGDADAIWISGTNQHPVIGTQLYRLRTVNGAGQFDMLGLNWLKHGFCAADGADCTALTNPPGATAGGSGCNWLGRYRTDYYSSGLNSSQSNLGPRSEVNPWTGVFPYPYILQNGTTGDAIFKRTQVPTSDLVSGAQYVFEVVYICTDEPVANRYNNYSYRLATIAGSGATATFTLSGPTQAMQTAIDAWKALDPQVVKTNVDPSGTTDGRITIGSRVTQTGPSTWHYEYVVHNMNNHASVRSFSLPLDSNVTITNVGFKDVAYHSGEPYDGTDWAFSSGGGAASWSTQTFAQNQNANAIRWGSAYSFRFDANIGPVNGSVTLGMFRTGSSVNVPNIQVPALPPPPTPGPFDLTSPADGAVVASLTPQLTWSASENSTGYDVVVALDNSLTNPVASGLDLNRTNWTVPAGVLLYDTLYHWGVSAENSFGSTNSNPSSQSFRTPPSPCAGDADNNGATNTQDLTIFLSNFGLSVRPGTRGDFDNDGFVTTTDLTIILAAFGCPG